MEEIDAPALPPAVNPPNEAALEMVRLRRHVRAQVFGGTEEATRIGRFRLLECIGRGGMGVVWSAHDEELDRTVAIKLLRPEFSGRDVTSEARALARLSHPNVVSVFDIGVHDDQRFIAMEYVKGETLRTWAQASRSTEEIVAQFVEAGRGLAAAHAVGLVHRDFKPDNVLVGDDGRPRVLDFGLARSPDVGSGPMPVLDPGTDPFSTTMTHAGLLIGTPAYMAPEQHLGEPAGPQSDQFAFAVALFEGIVGRLPFPADDLRTLSLRVVRGRFEAPPPATVPASVMSVLERALHVDPAARFASLDEMLERLSGGKEQNVLFDTRGADAVLSRAASLSAASSNGRGLSVTDLEEVAAEAGIEPHFARIAAEEATRVPSAPPVVRQVAAETKPAATTTTTSSDALRVRRRLPRLTPAVTDILVQELKRRAGSGKAKRLGASTVWEGRRLEATFDPSATETQLDIIDKPGVLDVTRPIRYGVLGWLLVASTLVPFTIELLEPLEALIIILIIPMMITGAFYGVRFSGRRGQTLRARRQRELESLADRLGTLADANLAALPSADFD
jgi:predicted Ser/Thr protein kinase